MIWDGEGLSLRYARDGRQAHVNLYDLNRPRYGEDEPLIFVDAFGNFIDFPRAVHNKTFYATLDPSTCEPGKTPVIPVIRDGEINIVDFRTRRVAQITDEPEQNPNHNLPLPPFLIDSVADLVWYDPNTGKPVNRKEMTAEEYIKKCAIVWKDEKNRGYKPWDLCVSKVDLNNGVVTVVPKTPGDAKVVSGQNGVNKRQNIRQ